MRDDQGLEAMLAHRVRLPSGIDALRSQYEGAAPFRHLVIDDLFPAETAEALLAEMPDVDDRGWHLFDDGRLRKFNTRSPTDLGPRTQDFVGFLHSALFLHFMTRLTGLRGLLPDPYMHGGGFHAVPRGGKFDVHVDSNVHAWTGLRRRVAVITFLNKDWPARYKGALELWRDAGSGCVTSIEPRFNRTVVFLSGEDTYHGYPEPLACPEGQFRRSFLTYLYTNDAHAVSSHSTLYAPSFERAPIRRDWMKEVTPPVLARSARFVMSRLRRSAGG